MGAGSASQSEVGQSSGGRSRVGSVLFLQSGMIPSTPPLSTLGPSQPASPNGWLPASEDGQEGTERARPDRRGATTNSTTADKSLDERVLAVSLVETTKRDRRQPGVQHHPATLIRPHWCSSSPSREVLYAPVPGCDIATPYQWSLSEQVPVRDFWLSSVDSTLSRWIQTMLGHERAAARITTSFRKPSRRVGDGWAGGVGTTNTPFPRRAST